jgi:hypothetical protein
MDRDRPRLPHRCPDPPSAGLLRLCPGHLRGRRLGCLQPDLSLGRAVSRPPGIRSACCGRKQAAARSACCGRKSEPDPPAVGGSNGSFDRETVSGRCGTKRAISSPPRRQIRRCGADSPETTQSRTHLGVKAAGVSQIPRCVHGHHPNARASDAPSRSIDAAFPLRPARTSLGPRPQPQRYENPVSPPAPR